LLRRYAIRRTGPHLLWWAAGIFFYGLGTALESAITLWGNSIALNKAWYIAGALLGGYPLAQGSVYLHFRRRIAHTLTALTMPVLVAVSILVVFSPVNHQAMQPHKPGGAILAWQWVRLLTPFINLYAVIFLIGTAMLSAIGFARRLDEGYGARALGNGLIAFGAILPGVGGGMAKAGYVEVLYVGEFIGLLFIWAGYTLCVRAPRPIDLHHPVSAQQSPAMTIKAG